MFTKILLPLISLVLLIFAYTHVQQAQQQIPKLPPPIEPARNPFPQTVAGAGIIEPETENISIGAAVAGVVVEVPLVVGQRVRQGDLLFRLDDRHLQAELLNRKAVAESGRATLQRLENEPRPERLKMMEAQLAEAEAKRAEAMDRWSRTERLSTQRIATDEELVNRKQAFLAAEAQVARFKAETEMTRAGAWEFDKQVARVSLAEAETRVKQTETEIERLNIRALAEGEILQINVRPGEFVATPSAQPLVVLGRVNQLHVRADIDEYDIPRFRATANARATLKGQPSVEFALKFVRVEPYVVPKKSLTGGNVERVDTRVLQVIYAIDAGDRRLFVGQQVDIFIEAEQAGGAK